MDIALCTSPFFRNSYCLYPFWNSSRSKTALVCKKTHGFVDTVLHTEIKSVRLFIWLLALSREGCDAPVIWRGWNLAIDFFGQNKPFFPPNICNICMFCGECGCICTISICVADNQLRLLWLNDGYHYECLYDPYLYDYHLYYRTSACDYWLLTAISVNVWPYQSMYYIQSFFFILFYYSNYSYCIVFFSAQINHLHEVEVYNNCIILKHAVICIMTKIV